MSVITPTVHLNGTSGQVLLDQATDAAQALRDALKAMTGAAPNGRDYYPQGPDAFKQAQDEHAARIDKVRAILNDYTFIAEAVADAMDARTRNRGDDLKASLMPRG